MLLYASEARDVLDKLLTEAKYLYLFPVGAPPKDRSDLDAMIAYQVYVQEPYGELRDISGLLSVAFCDTSNVTVFKWFYNKERAANLLADEIYGMMGRRSDYTYRVQVL